MSFKPYWEDDCRHGESEFLGTVIEHGGPVDVYLFEDGKNGDGSPSYGTCARFDSRPEGYRSGDGVLFTYRDQIDWEVELGAVIGRTGKYISANDAEAHIFGYMVSLDISDRGGRPPNSRPGSDWLVGKGHDTFAPLGPWIVPKEFYGNPMEILDQVLEIDGQVMQRAGPGDMIHSIYELLEYGSSIGPKPLSNFIVPAKSYCAPSPRSRFRNASPSALGENEIGMSSTCSPPGLNVTMSTTITGPSTIDCVSALSPVTGRLVC